jgi:hypothetical protein
MDSKIDRRTFIQNTGIAVLGAAGGAILIHPATAAPKNESLDRSDHGDIERWLLETGRPTLDNRSYSIAARQL